MNWEHEEEMHCTSGRIVEDVFIVQLCVILTIGDNTYNTFHKQ
jgi:hypothetical protein